MENLINKKAFRKMMALVWGLLDSMIFHEVGKTFSSENSRLEKT